MISEWLLPFGWKWTRIEGIAASNKNSIVDGPFGSNLKTSDYVDNGIPVLQGKNITNNVFRWFDVRFISEEKAAELKRSAAAIGDILIVKIGSIGYAAELDDLNGYPFAIIPANLAKLTIDEKKIDKGYLLHWLASPHVRRHFNRVASKTAQPALSLGKIKELPIPLPPLHEQKRIAAILDKADAIRRKRQKAIQLADDFLRAVFLDMFGSSVDKRDWKEVAFAEVALIDAKMVDPREAEYLDLFHIGPDRIEKSTGKLLPALTAREENLISKKFLFDQSYVLYSKIRPYLRKVALPDSVGLCSADIYPVRPKEGVLTREFLWQLLLSDDFTTYTETLPGRANIPKLNRNELNNYCFRLPPMGLQEKFSEIFRRQSQGYSSSESAKEMSDSAFRALSQKAFSGQL